MIAQDNLGLEYNVGTRRYILGKSILRCVDQSKPQNNFSIPLNTIDPNYSYGIAFSSVAILFAAYFAIGVIVRGIQWLSASPRFDVSGNIQLIIFSGVLVLICYRAYKDYNADNAFKFTFRHEDKIAFSIPKMRKQREKTQAFLNAIASNIHQATPSNEHILNLLGHYDLLTRTEWAQLDANITQNDQSDTVKTEPKSNIIHLSKPGI